MKKTTRHEKWKIMMRRILSVIAFSAVVAAGGCNCPERTSEQRHRPRFNLEDRLEIIDLVNRFTIYFDERELDKYIDCYADDGVFIVQRKNQEVTLQLDKSELEMFFGPRLEGFIKNEQQRRHLVTNVGVMEQNPADAVVQANALLTSTDKGDLNLATTLSYTCKLVKIESEWKFKEVVARLDRNLDVKLK